MTDQSEVEKIAKEMMDCYWGEDDIPNTVHALRLARWHIREKEIAVLEARINELQRTGDFSEYRGRYEELQSLLAELRKEPTTLNDKERG